MEAIQRSGTTGIVTHMMRDPSALTPAERETMRLIADGATTREAAALLGVAPKTVERRMCVIIEKLCVSTRREAVEIWRGRAA